MIYLFESSTCFEQLCAHPQEDNCINLLKPTGYAMHHQFNTQQLYALSTLYLCVLYLSVLYLSENKQRPVLLTA